MVTKLEIKRQLVHVCLGIIIIALAYFDIINGIIVFLAFLLFLAASFLTKKGFKIPLLDYFFTKLERKSEKKGLPLKGLIFYLLGSSIALIFFPKNIALASITILALGDSVSRLVGPYGYLRHPFNSKRFVEGIIVGGLVSILGAMLFVPFIYVFPAAVISMIIESLDIEINNYKVDDNLTIPVISCLVMSLIKLFIPG